MSLTGEAGGSPVRMGLPMGDLSGGMFGAFAVAGALFRRSRTGQGAHIDLSLLDGQVSLLDYIAQYFWTDGRVPAPMGSAHASVVPYQALATRDGHLIVAVFAENFWGGVLPRRRAIRSGRRIRASRRTATAWRIARRSCRWWSRVFTERATADWLERLQAAGVPVAPIQSRRSRARRILRCSHRRMVVEIEHPRHGALPTLGTPIKVDGAHGPAGGAAAGPGRAHGPGAHASC